MTYCIRKGLSEGAMWTRLGRGGAACWVETEEMLASGAEAEMYKGPESGLGVLYLWGVGVAGIGIF